MASAAGLLAVSWGAVHGDVDRAATALFFTAIAAAAERYQVRLRGSRPGAAVAVSVSCAVSIAVVLLFPLHWAVLIGGWKDMDSARKELDKIRAWQPPKNTSLMDQGVISRPAEGGRRVREEAYLNPFQYALVVPNPVAPKGGEAEKMCESLGYVRYGEVPGYARSGNGALDTTAFFYCHLDG